MPFKVMTGQAEESTFHEARVKSMYVKINNMPHPLEATIGQMVAPVFVASCMRTKYKPNPMPASRGSFKSARCEKTSVITTPSPWEIIHSARRAKPNPRKVRNGGKPCVKLPTITGSAAANKAETGAAMLINPRVIE